MGLLDDAIRDHLDLKRSRGADPGEVVQQEREALGAASELAAPNGLAAAENGREDGMRSADQAFPTPETRDEVFDSGPDIGAVAARGQRAQVPHSASEHEPPTVEVDMAAMLAAGHDSPASR